MKILGNLMIAASVAVVFTSCQKKEGGNILKEDITVTGQSDTVKSTAVNYTPLQAHDEPREDLIKEAQSHPLTNLVVSEDNFNFGDVKKGDHVQHVYTITNTGDKPLIISLVKPGCGCTVPEYTKEPIMPGKKGNVTLKFDSSAFEGLTNKYAEVYTNTEKSPVVLNFSANVINK